ncbi:hypothetical protein GQR58_011840 [Nymphon striatum]|nr:hypothetical protein GQR58_011840 [Nymphon striatum]
MAAFRPPLGFKSSFEYFYTSNREQYEFSLRNTSKSNFLGLDRAAAQHLITMLLSLKGNAGTGYETNVYIVGELYYPDIPDAMHADPPKSDANILHAFKEGNGPLISCITCYEKIPQEIKEKLTTRADLSWDEIKIIVDTYVENTDRALEANMLSLMIVSVASIVKQGNITMHKHGQLVQSVTTDTKIACTINASLYRAVHDAFGRFITEKGMEDFAPYAQLIIDHHSLRLSLIMDWQKCIVCQSTTSEALSNPQRSKRLDSGKVYSNFLDNYRQFSELTDLKDGNILLKDITVDDLAENNALWHRSCHQKFNNDKLERIRANKRKAETKANEAPGSSRPKRQSSNNTACVDTCIFCLSDRVPKNYIRIQHSVQKC